MYPHVSPCTAPLRSAAALQGYLAHKKTPSHRILQEANAYDPMEVLGGGRFLMREVPLYAINERTLPSVPPTGRRRARNGPTGVGFVLGNIGAHLLVAGRALCSSHAGLLGTWVAHSSENAPPSDPTVRLWLGS